MPGQVQATRRLDGPPRVVLLSFNLRPNERVIDLASDLLSQEAQIDLFVMKSDGWSDFEGHPRMRIHSLDGAEMRHPVRWVEHMLVYRAPLALLARARRLVGNAAPGRPVAALERGYERIADAFHRRVFMRVYSIVRPWVLARLFRKPLRSIDLSGVDRIIATDVLTVTLGWRLARRYPAAAATTSLTPPVYRDPVPADAIATSGAGVR